MPSHFPIPLGSAGPLSDVLGLLGLLAVFAWVGWRFGPVLARVAGLCSLWVAWACGSEGGYGYCAAFAVFGVLAWSMGTVWYARRRSRWPSTISARLLAHLPSARAQIPQDELPALLILSRRQR